MAEIRIDFAGLPDGVRRWEGGEGLPPPFVFLRDYRHTDQIPPTTLMHGMDGDVHHAHTVTNKHDLTFSARQHVMAHPFGEGGFQIIHNDLARVLYDGRMTVSVDISTDGYGSRKWPLFWFYPEEGIPPGKKAADPGFIDAIRDHLDLFAVPGSALFFKPERFNGRIGWGGWRTTGARFGAYWDPIPVAESFVTRFPHRFEFSGSNVELYIGDQLHWRANGVIPASWQGKHIVVALDFVDYNSAKEGEGETTWHWDNVLVRANHVAHAPGAIMGSPEEPEEPPHEHPEEPEEPEEPTEPEEPEEPEEPTEPEPEEPEHPECCCSTMPVTAADLLEQAAALEARTESVVSLLGELAEWMASHDHDDHGGHHH